MEKTQVTSMLEDWKDLEHVRMRASPRHSDADYFHFADLNEFIQRHASSQKIIVLDYGAGASPYKTYFPNADYRKADIVPLPEIRYRIAENSTIPEADNTFDVILSTQVAEHVRNPEVYFKECFRLLKPGGKLLLTTHGIWEEHGVPYDFQRWTEQGMRRDLTAAGFQKPQIYKLTCGIRALMHLFTRTWFDTTPPRPLWPKYCFKAFRLIYSRLFPFVYSFCDTYWPEDKIVHAEEGAPTPTFYIVIAAVAQK